LLERLCPHGRANIHGMVMGEFDKRPNTPSPLPRWI
jgi:hypothetical protein